MKKSVNKHSVRKTAETTPAKTTSEVIWDEIKDLSMDMFSLPGQTVSQYFKPAVVEPTKCYLIMKVGSALPALETTLGSKYSVEQNDKFTVVSKK